MAAKIRIERLSFFPFFAFFSPLTKTRRYANQGNIQSICLNEFASCSSQVFLFVTPGPGAAPPPRVFFLRFLWPPSARDASPFLHTTNFLLLFSFSSACSAVGVLPPDCRHPFPLSVSFSPFIQVGSARDLLRFPIPLTPSYPIVSSHVRLFGPLCPSLVLFFFFLVYQFRRSTVASFPCSAVEKYAFSSQTVPDRCRKSKNSLWFFPLSLHFSAPTGLFSNVT